MKWFLVVCVLLAVTNTVTSRPNKDKDPPNYEDDNILNDEDGYANIGDEDDEGEGDPEDEIQSDPPVIKTLPQNFKAKLGDIVDLPCETLNAESYSVMWKMNTIMMFQDKIQVGQRNERFQRFNNQTLRINRVQPSDDGEYECSISTSPEFIAVKHKLIVLTPPKITKATANNQAAVMVKRGGSIELECIAEGNPPPKVSWSKEGHRVSAEHAEISNSRVFKQNVGRDDAGIYSCMADNGHQKDPIIQNVVVDVTHKPDIKIEKAIVGETEVHLVCKVHASPSANVTWMRDNRIIKGNENIVLEHMKHDNIIKILKIDESYFGNYTCHAKNSIGTTEKHTFVSGTPLTPQYENHRFIGENNELKTKWTVMSMTPVKMIQLQYRKKGDADKIWKTESSEIAEVSGFSHIIEHVLKQLGEGVYEARLRAENKFGWSEYSKPISLEGNSAESISKGDSNVEKTAEPESSTDSGTRTIMSWTLVLVVIMLNMFSSSV